MEEVLRNFHGPAARELTIQACYSPMGPWPPMAPLSEARDKIVENQDNPRNHNLSAYSFEEIKRPELRGDMYNSAWAFP